MRVEQEAQASFVLGTMRNNLASTHGTERTQKTRRTLRARRSRMLLGYMTCTGTYGSGVRIGMKRMGQKRWTILVVLQRARSACFAAAAGSSTPGTAGRRSVAGSRLGTGTTSWASVSPEFRRTSQVKGSERSRCAARTRSPIRVANVNCTSLCWAFDTCCRTNLAVQRGKLLQAKRDVRMAEETGDGLDAWRS